MKTMKGKPLAAGELNALVNRAQAGDQAAIDEARGLLAQTPELWERVGNLAQTAEDSWIRLASNGEQDSIVWEAFDRKLTGLRVELSNPDQGPLERLLVDRVVLTWLQLNYAETMLAQRQWQGKTMPMPMGEYLDRRVTQAQRRHLAAIRCLATVRRLLAPAGPRVSITADQVNVAADGGQQVNTTGSVAGRPQLEGAQQR